MGSSWFVAASVLLVFAIFRFIFPVQNTEYVTQSDFKSLVKKYRKFDLVMIPVTLILIVVFTGAFGFIFYMISELRFSVFSVEGILMKSSIWMWLMPGFFIGTAFCTGVLNKIIDWHLKENGNEYRAYYNLKYRFDAWKAMRWVNGFAFLIGAVLLLFIADFYTNLQKDKLVLNPLFSLGKKEFVYRDLAIIAEVSHFKAPNGDVKFFPHYVLQFENGFRWSSRWDGSMSEEENKKLIEFLLQKTGKPLSQYDLMD